MSVWIYFFDSLRRCTRERGEGMWDIEKTPGEGTDRARKGSERGEFILTNIGVQGSESETRSTTVSTATLTNNKLRPKKSNKKKEWRMGYGRGRDEWKKRGQLKKKMDDVLIAIVDGVKWSRRPTGFRGFRLYWLSTSFFSFTFTSWTLGTQRDLSWTRERKWASGRWRRTRTITREKNESCIESSPLSFFVSFAGPIIPVQWAHLPSTNSSRVSKTFRLFIWVGWYLFGHGGRTSGKRRTKAT